jgi:hypothetical protein
VALYVVGKDHLQASPSLALNLNEGNFLRDKSVIGIEERNIDCFDDNAFGLENCPLIHFQCSVMTNNTNKHQVALDRSVPKVLA